MMWALQSWASEPFLFFLPPAGDFAFSMRASLPWAPVRVNHFKPATIVPSYPLNALDHFLLDQVGACNVGLWLWLCPVRCKIFSSLLTISLPYLLLSLQLERNLFIQMSGKTGYIGACQEPLSKEDLWIKSSNAHIPSNILNCLTKDLHFIFL